MSSENSTNPITLTISFIDSELTNAERDDELVQLLEDLSERSDIESVERLRDLNPPEGYKGDGGLIDLLKAEANPANALKVLGFLRDRLGNKAIALEAEVNGIKMKVSASSQEEVKFAINEINKFIEEHKDLKA